jgi:NADH-quinone oxidoreductase subunit N
LPVSIKATGSKNAGHSTSTALLAMMADVILLRKRSVGIRFAIAGGLGCFGCLLAIGRLLIAPATVALADGVFLVNPLTSFIIIIVLGLTVIVFLLSMHLTVTDDVGEYVLLSLLATVGMMFLVSTENLLVLFLLTCPRKSLPFESGVLS